MPFLKTFKKLMLGVAVVISLGGVFLAHSANASDTAPDPAIWKLSDHDSEIWLFGTIHILHPELSWRSEKVSTAFKASDIVYFEAPADQKSMQPLVMQHGLNKGTPLSQQMSETGRADLKRALASLGIPLGVTQQLEPLRPWLAGLTIAALQIQAQGGDPEAGVERILQADAKSIGKPIAYLESDEEQIQMLSGLSQADKCISLRMFFV